MVEKGNTIFDSEDTYYDRLLEWPTTSLQESTTLRSTLPSSEWTTLRLGKWLVSFLAENPMKAMLNNKLFFISNKEGNAVKINPEALSDSMRSRLYKILSLKNDEYYPLPFYLAESHKWNLKELISNRYITGPMLDRIVMLIPDKIIDLTYFKQPYQIEIISKWRNIKDLSISNIDYCLKHSLEFKSETLEVNRYIIRQQHIHQMKDRLPTMSYPNVSSYLVKTLMGCLLEKNSWSSYLIRISDSKFRVKLYPLKEAEDLFLTGKVIKYESCYKALRLFFGANIFDLNEKDLFKPKMNYDSIKFLQELNLLQYMLMMFQMKNLNQKEWLSILTSLPFARLIHNEIRSENNKNKMAIKEICAYFTEISDTLLRNPYFDLFDMELLYAKAGINYPYRFINFETEEVYFSFFDIQHISRRRSALTFVEKYKKEIENPKKNISVLDPTIQLPFDIEEIEEQDRGKTLLDLDEKYIPLFLFQVWQKKLHTYYFLGTRDYNNLPFTEISGDIPRYCKLNEDIFDGLPINIVQTRLQLIYDLLGIENIYDMGSKERWLYYNEDDIEKRISTGYIGEYPALIDVFVRKNKEDLFEHLNYIINRCFNNLVDGGCQIMGILMTYFQIDIPKEYLKTDYVKECVASEKLLGKDYKYLSPVLYSKWAKQPHIRKVLEDIVIKRNGKYRVRPIAYTLTKYSNIIEDSESKEVYKIHETMLLIHGSNDINKIENAEIEKFLRSKETLLRVISNTMWYAKTNKTIQSIMDKEHVDELSYYFAPFTLHQLREFIKINGKCSENMIYDVYESIVDLAFEYSLSPSLMESNKPYKHLGDSKDMILRSALLYVKAGKFDFDPRLIPRRTSTKAWFVKQVDTKVDYDEYDDLTLILKKNEQSKMYQVRKINDTESCDLEQEQEINFKEGGKVYTKGKQIIKSVVSEQTKPQKICVNLKK